MDTICSMLATGAWRMLQPNRYGGQAATADEFISAVCALAAQDGSAGWLCAMLNAAAYEVAGLPDGVGDEIWGPDATALVVGGYQRGQLVRSGPNRRLTGRWHAVAGAELAAWLLLTADEGDARYRVLVPRGEAQIEPAPAQYGLPAAGLCDVTVGELSVADRRIFAAGVQPSDRIAPAALAGAGAAVAVVGSAHGLWRNHVDQVRERLATSYGSDEVSDQTTSTRQVARAASDIDAAELQITASLRDSSRAAAWAQRQAASRARDAADHLLGSSRRHALGASDPVTRFWQDVHTGCRLTLRLLDGLDPS
jgi:3-hydroxy-9,10-secoandrosta-1,3,5(10)-triene-9,17-dione monooxygenase